jgi:hypothetical protein
MAGWCGFTTADEILNFFYRGTAISIGSNLYIRLLVAPSNRGGGGTETSYGGYARLVLPRGTTIFGSSSNGQMSNTVLLEFPSPSTIGNGELNSFDIVNTSSGAFTKIYNGGPILPAKAIEIGKPPKFGIGRLQFSF